MWAALYMRRWQAAWDDSAEHLVFYMHVFNRAHLAGWYHISKHKTEKNKKDNRPHPFCPQDYFSPSFLTHWISFLGQLWLQDRCAWQVTNPVTRSSRWELRTEPITKLESSEALLPLLRGRTDVLILLPLSFTGKLLLQAALAVIEQEWDLVS